MLKVQKNIDMQRYDSVTEKGTPLEVIKRYKGKISRSSFYTPGEMNLFNNKLTEDDTGVQQDQRFVLSPKGSNTLLIYTDGSLFQNCRKIKSSRRR